MLSDEAIDKSKKGVVISVHTAKGIIKALSKAIKIYLNHIQSNQLKKETSLKNLNKQNRPLKALDLNKNDVKGLRKVLNSYGVDFAVKKDNSKDGYYKVYFKAKDTTLITDALQDYTANKFKKTSIKLKMKESIEKAAKQVLKSDKTKIHSKEER